MDDVKLAFLDRLSFERLVGPCIDFFKRTVKYESRCGTGTSYHQAETLLTDGIDGIGTDIFVQNTIYFT